MKELEVRREGVKDFTGDFIISLYRTLGHLATVDVAITSRLLYYLFGPNPFLVSLLTFWRLLYFLILEMCSYRSAHFPVRRDETTT